MAATLYQSTTAQAPPGGGASAGEGAEQKPEDGEVIDAEYEDVN
jgi:hypothetical protein